MTSGLHPITTLTGQPDFDPVVAPGPHPRGIRTITDVIFARAASTPDLSALTFLFADGDIRRQMSYHDLVAEMRPLALALAAQGLAGQRVLLLHPQGEDFVVDFLATLAAGAIAVPAPHSMGRRAGSERIRAILADCAPALVLTTADQRELGQSAVAASANPALPVMTRAEVLAAKAGAERLPAIRTDALALLQYTSGSTGTPKGVMITHGGLMANQALIQARFGHGPDSVMVSWLPMFHDMGLIGSLLQPLYAGFPAVMMTPESFLENPLGWLSAIDHFGATTAGAPNFAYDFCVDRIPEAERAGLDLSRWQVAFNGSEPVRAATLDRFAKAFAPHGFAPNAAFPCYGMAEATLLVACGTPGLDAERLPRDAAPDAVSCGGTEQGHDIAVVDPETLTPLPEGEEGEIWIKGPSCAVGYWGRAHDPAFNAGFAGRQGDQATGWLRTGDLGLIEEDALYVTGRLKDVIILRGRNHHPSDLEQTAIAAHPGLRRDGGALVLAEAPGIKPTLILIHEVTTEHLRAPPVKEMAGALRAAFAAEYGLQLSILALIAPGRLPRTTSGKVRRAAALQAYLDGSLPLLAEDRFGPVLRRDPATSPLSPV